MLTTCKWGKVLPGSSFGPSAITVVAIKLFLCSECGTCSSSTHHASLLLSPECGDITWDVIPKSGEQGEGKMRVTPGMMNACCHSMLIEQPVLKQNGWRRLNFRETLTFIFWRKFEGRWFSCPVWEGGMGKSRKSTAPTMVISQNTESQGWVHFPLISPASD